MGGRAQNSDHKAVKNLNKFKFVLTRMHGVYQMALFLKFFLRLSLGKLRLHRIPPQPLFQTLEFCRMVH